MKRFIKYLIAILILTIGWGIIAFHGLLNGWWHNPITESKETEAFITAVKQSTKKEFAGNFAMAIMKDGKVDREIFTSHNKPVDRNTIFQVSSLSKLVSAVGIMKLIELGKVDLDTPVNNYLKRWKLPASEFNNEQVTVRRLLSHTAGLTDGLGYNGFESRDSVQSLEASLTKAKDADVGISGEVRVGMEPNSKWIYSGGGFTLLQLIMEETSGQSFNEFMTSNLFTPLNMSSSTYILNDSLNSRLCEFYNADKTTASHYYYTSLAATSLYTSLADLETFFQIFLKGKNGEPIGRGQLEPETLLSIREGHGEMMGAKIYGLGCMLYIGIENNEYIFGHDGKSTPPINTAIRINPVTGDGIIVLETGNPDLATRIASDWVYLQTGKVDTLLFSMLLGKTITIVLVGVLFIILFLIGVAVWRRKRKTAAKSENLTMKIVLVILLLAFIYLSFFYYNSHLKINEDLSCKPTDSTWSKTFGDSLKIEYIRKGDTLFQRRIDLKGLNEDDFDDSFNVVSIFSNLYTCKISEPKIVIIWDSAFISFPKNELIVTLEKRLKTHLPFFKGQKVFKVIDDDPEDMRNNEYDNTELIISKKYSNNRIDTVVFKRPYLLYGMIPMCKFDMYYKSEHITRVIIEEYKTDFSGGNYYYLLNDRSDTIAKLDLNL
ncbi:MAG: serine hydrolase [Bacteroidales bacterium]|nr:serine hydrolase [Bacteroidales bacterium]